MGVSARAAVRRREPAIAAEWLRVYSAAFAHYPLRVRRMLDLRETDLSIDLSGTAWDSPLYLNPRNGVRFTSRVRPHKPSWRMFSALQWTRPGPPGCAAAPSAGTARRSISRPRFQSGPMAATASDILKIIFAVILPPLGVFLEVGFKGHFWLSILLTLLGFIPGIIHALYVILKH